MTRKAWLVAAVVVSVCLVGGIVWSQPVTNSSGTVASPLSIAQINAANVDAGVVEVPAGNKICLDGPTCSRYLLLNGSNLSLFGVNADTVCLNTPANGSACFASGTLTVLNNVQTASGGFVASNTFEAVAAADLNLSGAAGNNINIDEISAGTAAVKVGLTNATEVDLGTSTTTHPVKIAGGAGAFVGGCTMSAAATCTVTVPTGTKCAAPSPASNVAVSTNVPSATVSGTTLTINSGGTSNSVAWTTTCL